MSDDTTRRSVAIPVLLGNSTPHLIRLPLSLPRIHGTMGIRMARRKRRVPIVSLIYKLDRLLPFSKRRKLKWYLDLEWSFDRLAMEYSFRHYAPEDHPHRRFANEFILRQLRPGMEVLDLGCNLGDMAVVLADHVTRVVGVDHNDSAILEAKSRHQRPNLTFIHADALEYLDNEPGRFDLLVLSHILEHIDEPEEFLGRFLDHFRWMYIEVPDFDKSLLNQYRLDVGNKLIYTD